MVRYPACANIKVTIMKATPLVLSAKSPSASDTTAPAPIPSKSAGAGDSPPC